MFTMSFVYVLLLLGPLDAVTSLTKVNSTISWEPPFSLDLTNVEPDIVYCVDVYNITCGGRDLVSSDCSVTDTNYTSLSDDYLYEYIVTPRSNVEGVENGTSQPFKGEFVMVAIKFASCYIILCVCVCVCITSKSQMSCLCFPDN